MVLVVGICFPNCMYYKDHCSFPVGDKLHLLRRQLTASVKQSQFILKGLERNETFLFTGFLVKLLHNKNRKLYIQIK